MVWGRAWRALALLGLEKDFRRVAGAPVDGSAGEYANINVMTLTE